MQAIGNMALFDVRARLPRANWEIGRRQGNPDGIVLHYNGPAVAPESQFGEGLVQKLIRNARWHMRPGSLGAPSGGDGLQYHLCVASDGQVLWMRDLEAQLWH
ncbi:MAG: hypothetical protein MUD01_06770, partial [Chloroflexaceae bacterium]|nr:hypothetical protein [Chloroflexaceae bacterium]